MKSKIFNKTFLKFLIVGGLGFVLNLIIFFILADVAALEPNLVAVIAFFICVTHNYILNHLWTFKGEVDSPPSFQRYFKYIFINCLGLIANLFILNLILIVFKPELKVIADFFAILGSVIINFLGSRLFVFPLQSPEKFSS